jgi:hypothetical protein
MWYKWQDDFLFIGDFANGRIEDVHTLGRTGKL